MTKLLPSHSVWDKVPHSLFVTVKTFKNSLHSYVHASPVTASKSKAVLKQFNMTHFILVLLTYSLLSSHNAQLFIYNDLTCDGLVINLLLAETSLPAGICVASTNGSDTSSVYKCQDGAVVTESYFNTDCSGNSITTVDLCAEIGNGASCNPYCGLGGCQYFVERTYYNVDNCTIDEPIGNNVYYDEQAQVIGYCSLSSLVLFGYNIMYENNGSHILSKTYTTNDCSGDPSSISVEGKIGRTCKMGFDGDVEAKYIRVGTATDTTSNTSISSIFLAAFIGILFLLP